MKVSSQTLFDRVLAYCELSPMTGPGILQRALADEGAESATATPADYRRALPHIESRLRAYYSEDDAARRARRIVGFLAFAAGEIEEDDERAFSKVGHSYEQLKAEHESRRLARVPSGAVLRDEIQQQISAAATKRTKR